MLYLFVRVYITSSKSTASFVRLRRSKEMYSNSLETIILRKKRVYFVIKRKNKKTETIVFIMLRYDKNHWSNSYNRSPWGET